MMKCPTEGRIQSYIDGELNDIEMNEVEMHIFQCEKCKDVYKELKSSNSFTIAKLQSYKNSLNIKPIRPSNGSMKMKNEKGVFNNMKKYKNIAAAACAAIVVTSCVTVTPIRAAITNAVSIFRVHDMKSVSVSLDDVKKLESELQAHKSDINIDKIGKIKFQGGEQKDVTLEDAKKVLPFSILVPKNMSDKNLESTFVSTPAKIDFTLNVENVNQILKSLGEKKVFPKDLDGKTFSLNMAGTVNINYRGNSNNSYINIKESKIPELNAPNEANVDEIFNALSELSILPQDMQTQLKSMKDWKSTLYVPNVGNKLEEMNIDGVKAFGYFENKNSSILVLKNDVLVAINGNIDKNEMINIVKSMR